MCYETQHFHLEDHFYHPVEIFSLPLHFGRRGRPPHFLNAHPYLPHWPEERINLQQMHRRMETISNPKTSDQDSSMLVLKKHHRMQII